MKEISLEPRDCECCGSGDLELVWSNRSCVKTHNENYVFSAYVVVCRVCGFCFNSPTPIEEDLNEYYADALAYFEEIPLHYSIESRIQILNKYCSQGANFIEIGGNVTGKFYNYLKKFFKSVQNVELNREVSSSYTSLEKIPVGSIDVIAHYDVLEHIPNVLNFLGSCHEKLKDDGIMVYEVPDVKLYPRNLMLFSDEHINHFSVTTLATIAQKCGFKLLEVGHTNSSRPFSFISAFRKTCKANKHQTINNPFEYLDTVSCVKDGITQVNRYKEHIKFLQKKITQLGREEKNITHWCVTNLLNPLLENFELPETAIVVDSDPRKSTHLKDKDITVFQPIECLEHIKSSELLAIFSPRNKENILEWIKEKTGKPFNDQKLDVVSAGEFGEPLQV